MLQESIHVNKMTVNRLIAKLEKNGSTKNLKRSGRPSKASFEVKEKIETIMRDNDETTSQELKEKIEQQLGIKIATSSIRRLRKKQGWTMAGAGYCQLISNCNKPKRLEFAQQILKEKDNFQNIIFSDESTIKVERYRRFCFRKAGEQKRKKPKPKHPVGVHVWAGISMQGATDICIFEGIIDASVYV